MNHPSLAEVIPRIYEDDVESDFIRDSMLTGLLDKSMSDATTLTLMLMFERVPVCNVECFEEP